MTGDYDVVMSTPTSVRFDDSVSRRLSEYVARHEGSSRSSVTSRYVDEGLRMDEHPLVVFREGPAGRRARVIGGPDVWEIIRDLRSLRKHEPTLSDEERLEVLLDNTGVSAQAVEVAVAYWAAYPDEVDAFLDQARLAEQRLDAAQARADALLGASGSG